jgi:hypothetical protein
MYKFSVGDKIIDTSNYRLGVIKRRGYNSVYQEGDYTIEWESSTEETVFQDYAEKIFKLRDDNAVREFNVAGRRISDFDSDVYCDAVQLELPLGSSQIDTTQKNSCNHSWVMYNGFSNSFEYCAKCDKKRG